MVRVCLKAETGYGTCVLLPPQITPLQELSGLMGENIWVGRSGRRVAQCLTHFFVCFWFLVWFWGGVFCCCCFGWLFFVFLGLHPLHMEVPRLGVEFELEPLAYAIATAMPYPRRNCNLHHSSQQCWILNPLIEARDWTYVLMDTSQTHFHWIWPVLKKKKKILIASPWDSDQRPC